MTPAGSRQTGQEAMSLLLLSSSATHARPYLSHALQAIAAHLSGRKRLLFVPHALADHDGYTATVAEAMRPIGVSVEGLHRHPDPASAVSSAEAVFVGGGNTFRLLRSLRRAELLGPLRDRVRAGLAYLGSSAGTNLACPTIRTTNDMPILDPEGFDALGLVPFQINPHYLDPAGPDTGRRSAPRPPPLERTRRDSRIQLPVGFHHPVAAADALFTGGWRSAGRRHLPHYEGVANALWARR